MKIHIKHLLMRRLQIRYAKIHSAQLLAPSALIPTLLTSLFAIILRAFFKIVPTTQKMIGIKSLGQTSSLTESLSPLLPVVYV